MNYLSKPATIKDIAKALHISASTVSRALNDNFEVSTETKVKVQAYAKTVNYRLNTAASTLRSRRSYSLGVMVADVANSFFSQTINGIESVAYERGYNVVIAQSHDSHERELINIDHLATRSVDGLLISMSAQTSNYEHIENVHSTGMPIVFFDRVVESINTFKVITDNFKTAFDATEILISKGFTRIAHLANAPQLSITVERLAGYRAALEKHAIPYDENLVKFCPGGGRDAVEVEDALRSVLSDPSGIEALFVASDRIIIESVRWLNMLNHTIDLPIIGFSNSDVIDLIRPKVSFIRQSAFEMGQVAARMLIKLIESKYPVYTFETEMLGAEIHWRD